MMRICLPTALSAVLLLLSACEEATGEGQKPSYIEVTGSSGSSTVTSVECTASQLAAAVYFEGDSGTTSGDFTERVEWVSSDETVVSVSNGDIENGSGTGTYNPGVILPKRPGTATITARYLDKELIDSIDVQVLPIAEMRITPDDNKLAPESFREYTLEAFTSSGFPVEGLNSEISWRLPSVSSPADLAAIGTSVTVIALEGPVAEPFTIEARFPSCDRSVTKDLLIEEPVSYELVTEQPEGAVLPLEVVEAIKFVGIFADGAKQNLTFRTEYDQIEGGSGDAVLTLYASGTEDDVYILEPSDIGETVQYNICLSEIDVCLDTPSYVIDELGSVDETLSVTPESLLLTYPEETQLKATLQFEDGVVRDVTRSVLYANSNAVALSVSSADEDSGRVASNNADQDTDIDVSFPAVSDDEVRISARVYSIDP